jgi:outer membrane lipoprotein-sorting protein
MKCNYISENVADLFDENIETAKKNEILEHIESCMDCRQAYQEMKQVISDLQPKISIEASESLKDRVIRKIEDTRILKPVNMNRTKVMFTPARKRMMAIAAVLIIFFALIPVFNHSGWFTNNARAGNALIKKSMLAMEGIKAVYMSFDVRTLEDDNFDFIDIHEGFVTHKLWKTFTEPAEWRIEKPGRIVVMDGKNQYLYIIKGGMAMVASPNAGFMGWMKIFLDPMQILGVERDFAARNKAEYSVAESGNTIVLTIKAKAIGDFRNAYMLNSSISESDSKRIYTFDKSSKRLLSFQIFVESGKKEYLVIKVNDIRYDQDVPEPTFTIALPEGVNWKQITDVYDPNKAGVNASTSEEVARMFFEGFRKEDWATVEKLYPGIFQSSQADLIKKEFGGLTVKFIGKSFKSGEYPGEFVPYEIMFKSGNNKKFNLALRKDINGKWMVDGGF